MTRERDTDDLTLSKAGRCKSPTGEEEVHGAVAGGATSWGLRNARVES